MRRACAPHPLACPPRYWNCEVLVSLQSISNFVVSLPSIREETWRDYFSVSSPFTHPRIGSRKGKREISFPSLRIHPFLLIVSVSRKTKRLLQAREIRRIDFSVNFRHDLRFSCGSRQRRSHRQQKQARRRACFVSFHGIFFELRTYCYWILEEKP